MGLVDESQGLHRASEQKPVTLSFVTAEVDEWYAYLRGKGVEIVHELADGRRQPTRGFVAKDPEGYYLEFETFRVDPQNRIVRGQLAYAAGPQEREAMAWVDAFLKRYLGQFDESLEHPVGWNPLTILRDDLAPELMAALQADRDASAASDEEIVGLDFDPFINAQDICDRYTTGRAIWSDTTMDVSVHDTCDWGHPLIPDVIYILRRHGARRVLEDIRYGGGQSLREVLAYYAEQRKQP